ncbi:MFS general substrate transporter [Glarea lozoyensis ATCC 20868]|uniref:MFS general substrate transporter n=1 Tax=Glarea lozoyensis (strain ATCC 20868 / MF5171) TaxID=1116229 RepID=S3DGU5_GLAL2|nr:MFS general substrate transporter [Glarea lozoyensis ATCC 20868]EPE36920.1 MFS general substrate transporter [Glarea lozoyensis ATCC 20868]
MAEGVISRFRRFSGLDKAQMEHAENVVSVESNAASDAVLVGGERVEVTEEDDIRIRKKTDKNILTILVWVYFLQILDKSVLGYGSIFGLQKDVGLVGNQYSLIGSIAPIAQLIWQPFSSILIVKVPHRILMPCLVLGWGIAQTAMAGCRTYHSLLAARFFLGLFEAGCLPLFSVITNQWYRRAEQPIRVAAWYSTNGAATIVAAFLSYGLAYIPSEHLRPWQIIFLFVGLLTIISAPLVYWRLSSTIPTARFLTPHERLQAIERLRANQTGIGSSKFEWSHIYELLLEPKTYLWISMALLVNVGASVTNTFGPLILSTLPYPPKLTSLLTTPFGFLQLAIILLSSLLATRTRLKSPILILLTLPVLTGLSLLLTLPRTPQNRGPLLLAYYLLSFLFGSQPLIISWLIANTGGTTKKSALTSLYNAASAAGNIIGPLLYTADDAPGYKPGLQATLGMFMGMAVVVVAQVGVLWVLNRRQEARRVAAGKGAVVRDLSMERRYVGTGDGVGEHAFEGTDGGNEEFVYVY